MLQLKTPTGPPPTTEALRHPPLLGMVAGKLRQVYYEPAIGFYLAGARAFDPGYVLPKDKIFIHIPNKDCPALFLEKKPVACSSWQFAAPASSAPAVLAGA